MAQPTAIDKFFDAVDEAYDVILDTLKAGADRGHRVSRTLIDQAQQGQHDAIQMAHTIAQAPTNIGTVAGAAVQSLTKTQGRVLELSRQWLDEAVESSQEGREALRRWVDANRHAGEAVVEASRGVFGRAQERARQVVRPRRGGNSAKAQGGTRSRRKARAEETQEG